MPTVHNNVRMAPINTAYANQYANQHPAQTPRTMSTMMGETPRTLSSMMVAETPRTGMPQAGQGCRIPSMSGRYALCLELGQRIGIACELSFSGFPEMKIAGNGHDRSDNKYAISGFWNTSTNAFQLTLDLSKMGKVPAKPDKPRVRSFPTIQCFGIREPHGVRFSGEAHCCMGLGPFGLKSIPQLKADKKACKYAHKAAVLANRANNMHNATPAARPQARPGNTLPMTTPRTASGLFPTSSARPRAMTASAAQMASARGGGSGYFAPPGAGGQREFRANPRAFQQAHAHSQRAAQAQARQRAMTGLTSPQYEQMRRAQQPYDEYTNANGFEHDHSADGFDDEAFEAMLILSPSRANANDVAAQQAALAQFAAAKEAKELAATIAQSRTTSKKVEEVYDFEYVEETIVEKPQKMTAVAEKKPKKTKMMYGIEVDDDEGDSGEPPLPGDGPNAVSPRPEWMEEVFEDFEDGMTMEL